MDIPLRRNREQKLSLNILNKVEMLENADDMPGKWNLLIFLGQQTILNLQKQTTA